MKGSSNVLFDCPHTSQYAAGMIIGAVLTLWEDLGRATERLRKSGEHVALATLAAIVRFRLRSRK